jgi:hypothetical protein
MNKYPNIDKDQQHAFYMHGIPKGKRFGRWIKKSASEETTALLSAYYRINNLRAEELAGLLSHDELEIIKTKMGRGGRHGRGDK